MNKTKAIENLKIVVNEYRVNLTELNRIDAMIEENENSVTDEYFNEVFDKHCELLAAGTSIVKGLISSDDDTARALFVGRTDKLVYLLSRMS